MFCQAAIYPPPEEEVQQQKKKAQNAAKMELLKSARQSDEALMSLLKEMNKARKSEADDKAKTMGKLNRDILIHLINVTRQDESQRELYNTWVEKTVLANDWCTQQVGSKFPEDKEAYAKVQRERAALLKAE